MNDDDDGYMNDIFTKHKAAAAAAVCMHDYDSMSIIIIIIIIAVVVVVVVSIVVVVEHRLTKKKTVKSLVGMTDYSWHPLCCSIIFFFDDA